MDELLLANPAENQPALAPAPAATEPAATEEPTQAPIEPGSAAATDAALPEGVLDAAQAEAGKTRLCLKALKAIERDLQNIIRLLETNTGNLPALDIAALAAAPVVQQSQKDLELVGLRQPEGRVIEGVFDGTNMVGSDGKIYTVPANYASKSKLVEGDLLKLTITPKGSFIYKQIGPIERARVIGNLGFDPTNNDFYATADTRRWSILKASVTYFKGDTGDEVVLLVPKNAPSKWAAVENIIKKNPLV